MSNADNRSNGSVHAWRISATGDNTDSFHLLTNLLTKDQKKNYISKIKMQSRGQIDILAVDSSILHRELFGGFGLDVLKAGEGKKLYLFDEIKSEIVFNGRKLMFLLVDLRLGQIIPEHSHPHEQMGLCLKGKAEFISNENRFNVEAGMFYWIKPNEPHSVKVAEESTFLDVFSPPREDYLALTKKHAHPKLE